MKLMYKCGILALIGISLPYIIFIGLAIALTSGFPVIFRQKRTGFKGKPFHLYKFRTMIRGAEDLQKKYRRLNAASGPVFKIHNDPRFTPIGRFLSHTGLDELPQLWNVLRGEMALIGPRPLPVNEAAGLASWMLKRHDILPGIISPWVLDGYHKRTFTEWMKSDLQYVKEKSPVTDLRLAVRTVKLIGMLIRNEVQPSKSGPGRLGISPLDFK